MSAINRKFFFNQVSLRLFDGRLTAKTRRPLNQILDYWEKNHSKDNDRWLAYALGTAIMKPPRIWERQGKEILSLLRPRPRAAHLGTQLQENEPSRRRRLGQISGPRIGPHERDPHHVCRHEAGHLHRQKVCRLFQQKQRGLGQRSQIINGLDKAQLIASYAEKYYGAISYTT